MTRVCVFFFSLLKNTMASIRHYCLRHSYSHYLPLITQMEHNSIVCSLGVLPFAGPLTMALSSGFIRKIQVLKRIKNLFSIGRQYLQQVKTAIRSGHLKISKVYWHDCHHTRNLYTKTPNAHHTSLPQGQQRQLSPRQGFGWETYLH